MRGAPPTPRQEGRGGGDTWRGERRGQWRLEPRLLLGFRGKVKCWENAAGEDLRGKTENGIAEELGTEAR